MKSKIVLIIIGVIVPLLLITFLHISIYIKPNAPDINGINETDNGFATEDMNTDEMAIETELLYQDILNLGGNEFLIDSRLPNGSVNMIILEYT